MKGRLNKALWLLIMFDVAALFAVLLFAFYGGAQVGTGASITDLNRLNIRVFVAFVICLGASLVTWIAIANRVVAPVKQLTDFSDRLAHGDFRTKISIESADDFSLIADNLNRAAESSSRAMFNQEAQESLQKKRHGVLDHRQPDRPRRPDLAWTSHQRCARQCSRLRQLHVR